MVLGHATGGVGAHVDSLVAGLRAQGHDVEIATAASTAQSFGWSDAHLLWPVHGGLRAPRGSVDWHCIRRLAGTVEVVHAHGHQAAVLAAVAVARARPRPRLVVSLHKRPAAPRPLAHGACPRGCRASRRPLGPAARRPGHRRQQRPRRARRLLGRPPCRAGPRVVGCGHRAAGVHASRRRRPGGPARGGRAPADQPLVVTVSRIAPQKDLPTLVRAAGPAWTPATWVVIGDGDQRLRARLELEADGIRPGWEQLP